MAPSGRAIPRFLPTLTEVVQPGALHPQPVSEALDGGDAGPAHPVTLSPEQPATHTPAVADGAAAENMVLLRAQMEQRVRQIVAGALAAQVERITHQVMGELEPAMRQLVRETVRTGGA